MFSSFMTKFISPDRRRYGQRPYNNFERVMFDAGAQTFDTIMGALGSNNERWGFNDIRLELERAGGAAAAAPAAAAAGSAPAPAASAAPAAAKPAAPAGPAVVQAEFRSVNGTATTVRLCWSRRVCASYASRFVRSAMIAFL